MSRRNEIVNYNHRLSYVGTTVDGQRCFRCLEGYFLVPAGVSFANNDLYDYLVVVYTPHQNDVVNKRVATIAKSSQEVFPAYLSLLTRIKDQGAVLYKTHRHNLSMKPHLNRPGKTVLGVSIPKGVHCSHDTQCPGVYSVWFYGALDKPIYVGRGKTSIGIRRLTSRAVVLRRLNFENFQRRNKTSYRLVRHCFSKKPQGLM